MHANAPNLDAVELRTLGLDLVQMALDFSGIVDPTPVSDGTNGLIRLPVAGGKTQSSRVRA